MRLCIDKKKITSIRATKMIPKNDLERQIVRAWCQSKIDHCFESQESFQKSVKRNRKTLESDAIETLFTSRNYLFSTKANYRKETLYFKDQTTKQTGRLRQQHLTGPLAKIDKNAKCHRFVSKKRYKFLKRWHKKHPCQLPRFCSYEQPTKVGKHHIEFAFERDEVLDWHASEGKVEIRRGRDRDHRIASALENIVGIRRKKIKK